MITNSTHQGYVDGINGLDPDMARKYIDLDYLAGWKAGVEDREAGLT